MTCIVGWIGKDRVYVGGDSARAEGWQVRQTSINKVLKKENFLFGYTTSFRMGQIIQHHVKLPERKKLQPILDYLVVDLIEAIRKQLTEKGFTKKQDNRETGGSFIIGCSEGIFRVDADFQVNSASDGLEAVGCGEDYALGAMKALNNVSDKQRIQRALETAAYFCGGVLPPFTILSVPKKQV